MKLKNIAVILLLCIAGISIIIHRAADIYIFAWIGDLALYVSIYLLLRTSRKDKKIDKKTGDSSVS